jgi:hypothetical protein
MNQKGKITIGGLIILLVIIYGAYAAFVFLGARVEKSQIANEVKDTMGMHRGGDFNAQKGEQVIRDILYKHDIIFTEEHESQVSVQINRQMIEYFYTFEIEMDFLFFKRIMEVENEDRMRSYE